MCGQMIGILLCFVILSQLSQQVFLIHTACYDVVNSNVCSVFFVMKNFSLCR